MYNNSEDKTQLVGDLEQNGRKVSVKVRFYEKYRLLTRL